MNKNDWIPRAVCLVAILLGLGGPADGQTVDVTVFVGRAYPLYDERLTLRPPTPTVPGVDISVAGSPLIEADGGPVFGGAVALEFGLLGIEGRLDATEVGLNLTGARYTLRGTEPPFEGATADITVSDGRFDADRIPLLSVNARLRTPGPVALIASGGLSYLPDVNVSGSIPLRVDIPGIPPPPGFNPTLTLVAAPGQSASRWGMNGGIGLRFGGRVALVGEMRVFYFREYQLRFQADDGSDVLDEWLAGLRSVRFDPVFVNAQVGVSFGF